MELLNHLESRKGEIVRRLEQMVNLDTPTDQPDAVGVLGGVLRGWLEAAGARVETHPAPGVADHLLARWGEGERQILIIGHIDTVWPLGEAARRPFRLDEGGRASGPGVFDMKCGVLQAVTAMETLGALGRRLVDRRVALLINTDEEVGSLTSRPLIEAEAGRSAAVLVPEPAGPPFGALKTARKGVGIFELAVAGRASHAGAAHADGINALEELAHQVLRLQALTDYERGTTVNVGLAGGGSRPNVVPAAAWARVDARVTSAAEGARLDAALAGLRPVRDGAEITIGGGWNRPPMERTEGNLRLFGLASELARDLGFAVGETASGGGSDGNFTSALGVPTLDGLGACGGGAHALTEHLFVDEIPRRTALLARLIETI